MASNAGNVTSRYNYDAYGVTQTGTTSITAETSFQYCGEQYDSGLQMYNLRARYYSPTIGRFNQRDSFEPSSDDPQALHKYLYAQNDPLNCIDPSGNETLLELVWTETIRTIVANVMIGGIVNAALGAAINGETSISEIMYNFGTGGLLGMAGGLSAAAVKSLALKMETKLGWQIAMSLFYYAGKASMNALLDTISAALRTKYIEHKSFTVGDFFNLFQYMLFANLVLGALFHPLEHAAEEAKPYSNSGFTWKIRKRPALPEGWQTWSRAARAHFLKSARTLAGFNDPVSAQGILINLAEKVGTWLAGHEADRSIFDDPEREMLNETQEENSGQGQQQIL